MKKLFLILLFVLSFTLISTPSFAFMPPASCFINGVTATCSVYNAWGTPIVCSGNAIAITYRGWQAFVYMNNQIIYPGEYRYLYLNANNYYDPFARAWTQLNCNWWYW